MAVPALRQKSWFHMYFEWSGGYKFFGYGLTQIYLFRIYVIYRYWACRTTFIMCVFKKGEGSRGTPPLSFSLRKIQFCTVTENSFRPPPHPTPPDNQNYPLGPPSLGKLICMVNWHSNTCRSWSIRYTPILDITNLSKPFNRCVL